jgi:hypothetical protein
MVDDYTWSASRCPLWSEADILLRPTNVRFTKIVARPIIPNECANVVRNIASSSLMIFETAARIFIRSPRLRERRNSPAR